MQLPHYTCACEHAPCRRDTRNSKTNAADLFPTTVSICLRESNTINKQCALFFWYFFAKVEYRPVTCKRWGWRTRKPSRLSFKIYKRPLLSLQVSSQKGKRLTQKNELQRCRMLYVGAAAPRVISHSRALWRHAGSEAACTSIKPHYAHRRSERSLLWSVKKGEKNYRIFVIVFGRQTSWETKKNLKKEGKSPASATSPNTKHDLYSAQERQHYYD